MASKVIRGLHGPPWQASSASPSSPARPPKPTEHKIAAALGKSGTEMPGGVYRIGLPRTDLHVTLDGVELSRGSPSARGLPFGTTAALPW